MGKRLDQVIGISNFKLGRKGEVVYKVVRVDLTKKMTCEQRCK